MASRQPSQPNEESQVIRNAVVVASEARALCLKDTTPELEAALVRRAADIVKRKHRIETGALAVELLAWLNGSGKRRRRLRAPARAKNAQRRPERAGRKAELFPGS